MGRSRSLQAAAAAGVVLAAGMSGCAGVIGLGPVDFDGDAGGPPGSGDGGAGLDAARLDGAGAGTEAGAADGASVDASVEASSPPCDLAVDCPRYVFVTSTRHPGNLGGPIGADQLCTERARAQPKLANRSFLALVTIPGVTIAARHVHGSAAYRRVDEVVVADDWNQLIAGPLRAPVNRDELGAAVTSVLDLAWTGAAAGPTTDEEHCRSWTSSDGSESGAAGNPTSTGASWLHGSNAACAGGHRLFCIER